MNLEEIFIEEEIIKVPNPDTGEDEEWIELTATRSFVAKVRMEPNTKGLPDLREHVDKRLRQAIIQGLLKDAFHYIENNGKDYDFISIKGSTNSMNGTTYETPLTNTPLLILHPTSLMELAIIRS